MRLLFVATPSTRLNAQLLYLKMWFFLSEEIYIFRQLLKHVHMVFVLDTTSHTSEDECKW